MIRARPDGRRLVSYSTSLDEHLELLLPPAPHHYELTAVNRKSPAVISRPVCLPRVRRAVLTSRGIHGRRSQSPSVVRASSECSDWRDHTRERCRLKEGGVPEGWGRMFVPPAPSASDRRQSNCEMDSSVRGISCSCLLCTGRIVGPAPCENECHGVFKPRGLGPRGNAAQLAWRV